jgi:hypothetical protein
LLFFPESKAGRLHLLESKAGRLHLLESKAGRLHLLKSKAGRLHLLKSKAGRFAYIAEPPASSQAGALKPGSKSWSFRLLSKARRFAYKKKLHDNFALELIPQ